MNRAELRKILDREGFHPDAYSLDGGLRDDTFCLGQRHEKWVVYYSERSSRWGEQRFTTEHDACEYFLARMMRQIREITKSPRNE